MAAGSLSDEALGPYGERYNDIRERFSDRLAALEKQAALLTQEIGALRENQNVIKLNFDKHTETSAIEARLSEERRQAESQRVAEKQQKLLDAMNELQGQLRVIAAQRGMVPFETIVKVFAATASLVVIVGGVVAALTWGGA